MDIVIRASIMFFFLFIALRMIGAREIGELSSFELIVTIVLGDLIQQSITQNDFSLTGAALATGTIIFWSMCLSWASFLFGPARRLLEGEPRIVVRDGEFREKAMRPARLSHADVETAMRGQGIDSIDKIAWGVFEPNGRLTFIKRDSAV